MGDLKVKVFDQAEVTQSLLEDLKPVLDSAYFHSQMFENLIADLEDDESGVKAFVLYENSEVVSFCATKHRRDFIDKYNFLNEENCRNLCRVVTRRGHRSKGHGSYLKKEIIEYYKNNSSISYLLWATSEVGAMKFYLENGAYVDMNSVEGFSDLNSAKENLTHWWELVNNKRLKEYRIKNVNIFFSQPVAINASDFLFQNNFLQIKSVRKLL
jgi:GNAT superfamily N-acetyltransferase